MKKGFSIACLNCQEIMTIDKDFLSETDNSKITVTAMYSRNDLLFFACGNCKNEIEKEV